MLAGFSVQPRSRVSDDAVEHADDAHCRFSPLRTQRIQQSSLSLPLVQLAKWIDTRQSRNSPIGGGIKPPLAPWAAEEEERGVMGRSERLRSTLKLRCTCLLAVSRDCSIKSILARISRYSSAQVLSIASISGSLNSVSLFPVIPARSGDH